MAKKKLSREETLMGIFNRNHYISMYTTSTECDMGDHIDVTCTCGYKNITYGSTYDIIIHVIEVLAKEFAIESSTV
jgi:hypothetical protein